MSTVFDKNYQLERFSKSEEEFDAFYDNELKDIVHSLEKERLAIANYLKKSILMMIGPVILAIILSFIFDWVFVAAFIGLVAYGRYLYKNVQSKRSGIEKKIKKEIVTDLVSFMNGNFNYVPNSYVPASQFRDTKIFKHSPNRYTGEDLITGYVSSDEDDVRDIENKPPRTDVSFSEIQAENVQRYKDKDGKTRERVRTVFKGLFFKVDFNKDFEGLTIIAPKERGLKSLLLLGEENGLEEVELESPEFMDKFVVETTDQILARYILTPGFMNRLLDFANRHSEVSSQNKVNQPKTLKEAWNMGMSAADNDSLAYSNTPYFSFRNGTMYFMLPTQRNHFDFSVLAPLNKKLIYSYFHDINIALAMVDELNLNLRIWTKE